MRSYCVIGAVLALAGTAAAGDVTLDFKGTGNGRSFKVTSTLINGGAGGSANVFAGQLKHDVTASSSSDVALGHLVTFCTEVAEFAGDGDFDVTDLPDAPVPGAGMDVDKARAIARIYKYATGDLGLDLSSSTLDSDFAAAFQLTIWEIVEDFDNLNLQIGKFSATKTGGGTLVGTDVQTEFNILKGVATDLTRGGIGIAALTNNGKQDQIIIIPLPGTAGLAAFGLAGVGLAARRRRG